MVYFSMVFRKISQFRRVHSATWEVGLCTSVHVPGQTSCSQPWWRRQERCRSWHRLAADVCEGIHTQRGSCVAPRVRVHLAGAPLAGAQNRWESAPLPSVIYHCACSAGSTLICGRIDGRGEKRTSSRSLTQRACATTWRTPSGPNIRTASSPP